MAFIRVIREGISKVPINEEYIMTPKFSKYCLGLFTKGTKESKDALDYFGEYSI